MSAEYLMDQIDQIVFESTGENLSTAALDEIADLIRAGGCTRLVKALHVHIKNPCNINWRAVLAILKEIQAEQAVVADSEAT